MTRLKRNIWTKPPCFGLQNVKNSGMYTYSRLDRGPPPRIPVTTRIFAFLVGDSKNKLSFATSARWQGRSKLRPYIPMTRNAGEYVKPIYSHGSGRIPDELMVNGQWRVVPSYSRPFFNYKSLSHWILQIFEATSNHLPKIFFKQERRQKT